MSMPCSQAPPGQEGREAPRVQNGRGTGCDGWPLSWPFGRHSPMVGQVWFVTHCGEAELWVISEKVVGRTTGLRLV